MYTVYSTLTSIICIKYEYKSAYATDEVADEAVPVALAVGRVARLPVLLLLVQEEHVAEVQFGSDRVQQVLAEAAEALVAAQQTPVRRAVLEEHERRVLRDLQSMRSHSESTTSVPVIPATYCSIFVIFVRTWIAATRSVRLRRRSRIARLWSPGALLIVRTPASQRPICSRRSTCTVHS